MNKDDINIAFEILLEEIEKFFQLLSKEVEKAFDSQNFERASFIVERGKKLAMFREKIKSLQEEWQTLFEDLENVISAHYNKDSFKTVVLNNTLLIEKERKITGRLEKGLRTPAKKYKIPILESLIELGGKARIEVILNKVYEKMKKDMTKYDFELLPSGKEYRWRNTAQWARLIMVKEGLLSTNSPRGIWEITEKGREFYKRHKTLK
ncbi:winged helix-turn-helix domain-containing protein [Thermosipho sp. 1244]|uniref:winged helix-turn-helix domain-containing protein n=1 Tax=Thermosipho sp. 1244 TaxID=1755816 RepID=UPI001BDDE166|nr:winged helix-turn-helix domain-containing protein [Thermosipho sp. 1244]MBT1248696.1 hypothetical protein [Thermosipho sp. 1244]